MSDAAYPLLTGTVRSRLVTRERGHAGGRSYDRVAASLLGASWMHALYGDPTPDRAARGDDHRMTEVLNRAGVTLTPAADAHEWDAAVLSVPTAIPFHAWDFLSACAADWSLRFEPLVVRIDGQVVGGVPRLVDRRLGLVWINHLNLLNFIGPAVRPEHLSAVLDAMGARDRLTTMNERQEVRVAPDHAPDARGWTRRTAHSMVVPLADRTLDDVNAQAGKNWKAAPRLARKYGTVLEPSTEEDLRVHLPRLMDEVFTRAQSWTPYKAPTYWNVFESFAARGKAQAVTARIDGEVAAVAVTLLSDSDVAWEWVAADDGRFRKAEVSLATQRHLIQWAHEAGYSAYELLGGTTPGIEAFKRSMGAQPVEYSIYTRGHRS